MTDHWHRLAVPHQAHVLVPLAGKTVDMLWLAQHGHTVTGLELSATACEAFFADNGLQATQAALGPDHVLWQSGRLRMVQGDALTAPLHHLPGPAPTAIYDRAATVALPPTLRQAYATAMARWLAPGGQVLLVVFDYPQEARSGPPFAISAATVQELYGPHFHLTPLQDVDLLVEDPEGYARWPVSRLQEHVWQMVRD